MKTLLFGALAAFMLASPLATAQEDIAEATVETSATPQQAMDAGIEAAQRRAWSTARVQYEIACDGGIMEGCTGLADLYRKGLGGIKSERTSERLLKRACRRDEYNACATLGYLYNQGIEGPADLKASRDYYKIACDGEVVSACAAYGNQLYGGVGGAHNRTEGKRLLQAACSDEFEWACERLVDLGFSKRDGFRRF
ncbi:MAG: hypothetical protein AAFX02_05340 [Pseudomonadota bacterium]